MNLGLHVQVRCVSMSSMGSERTKLGFRSSDVDFMAVQIRDLLLLAARSDEGISVTLVPRFLQLT